MNQYSRIVVTFQEGYDPVNQRPIMKKVYSPMFLSKSKSGRVDALQEIGFMFNRCEYWPTEFTVTTVPVLPP